MSPKNLKSALFYLSLVVVIACGSFRVPAQIKAGLDEARQKAEEFFEKQNFTEALPYVEKLIKATPEDPEIQFMYGFCLLGQSKNTKDKEAAKQLVIKSRQAFVRSKQLGKKSDLLEAMITSLPEDGILGGKFSKNEEAEDAMSEAEAFFTQGKMDEAIASYQKALKLDPNIYEAALFTGDANTQRGNFAEAEIWYQKAIAINPDRETAYRYSATPLMKQGKTTEARDRYIEAFIVEPYNRFSTAGISQWGQATNTRLGHPRIDVPEIKYDAQGKASTVIDGSAFWFVYPVTRETWRKEKFAKAFPGEKEYRHTLQEEAEALRGVIKLYKEKKSASPDQQLDMLTKLDEEGFLESYILLAIPDQGVAYDHAGYLKSNRAKLRGYVLKYVVNAGN